MPEGEKRITRKERKKLEKQRLQDEAEAARAEAKALEEHGIGAGGQLGDQFSVSQQIDKLSNTLENAVDIKVIYCLFLQVISYITL